MNKEQSTIDLKELFTVLVRNILFIVIITAFFTVAVGAYTVYNIPAKYESETLFNVSKTTETTNTSSDVFRYGTELAKRYSIVATSNAVLDAVKTDIANKDNQVISVDDIKKSISIVSVDETDILRITITYPNANIAQKLADYVREESKTIYEKTYPGTTINTIDEASFNPNQVSPNLKLNVVIGFVLGLMISVGFVLIKEFMNRKLKTDKEIEQFLDIPYFGSIPEMKSLKKDTKG